MIADKLTARAQIRAVALSIAAQRLPLADRKEVLEEAKEFERYISASITR